MVDTFVPKFVDICLTPVAKESTAPPEMLLSLSIPAAALSLNFVAKAPPLICYIESEIFTLFKEGSNSDETPAEKDPCSGESVNEDVFCF